MLPKPLRIIWGNLSNEELKRFGLLAISLMLTLGPYWMLRGIREAIFIDLVGVQWQPWVRIFSFFCLIPIILLYSKLVDLVRRDKFFFIIYYLYAISFTLIAFFVQFPEHATLHLASPLYPYFAWIPGHFLGWVAYIAFDTFGIVTATLFWSLVASTTTTKSAKRGYGMIISLTQVGTIGGTLIVAQNSQRHGLPILILFATLCVAIVPWIIKVFVARYKQEKHKNHIPLKKRKKTGFFEGLRLLVKRPYLMGIFVITTAYEAVSIMLEFQLSLLGHHAYPTKEAFAQFYSQFGFYTNLLALVFALTGTSFLLRKFGLRVCLLLFPTVTMLVIFSVGLFPVLPIVVVALVTLKGLNYSLNNPAKEILYIPTSRDIKFKAKGWIDAFGLSSVKASGSGINALLSKLAPTKVIIYSAPILILIVSFWGIVARATSKKNHELVENKEIIK